MAYTGRLRGGYCHMWAIQVCAAVKGMVFKQFTLGQGILRPKEVPFSGLRCIFEREGISLVKVYKRLGKSVIWVCKEGLTDAFYGCEKKMVKEVGMNRFVWDKDSVDTHQTFSLADILGQSTCSTSLCCVKQQTLTVTSTSPHLQCMSFCRISWVSLMQINEERLRRREEITCDETYNL